MQPAVAETNKKSPDRAQTIMGVDTSIGKGQYLAFFMEKEEYAIDILSVMEIRGWEQPTPLPATHKAVKGVINLRGNIIPVVDLREKFKLSKKEYSATTVVIVLQVNIDEKTKYMGIVVDAVSEVYNVSDEVIKKVPDIMTNIDTTFIKGLADIDHKMIILLDVERLFRSNLDQNLEESLEQAPKD